MIGVCHISSESMLHDVVINCVCVCVQMEEVLERITAKEADIDSVGTNVVQTEQLLMDLEILDANAQVTNKVTQHAHSQSFWCQAEENEAGLSAEKLPLQSLSYYRYFTF